MQGQAGPFEGCPPRSRSAAQMDGCSRQNPAYRPATEGPPPAGGLFVSGWGATTRARAGAGAFYVSGWHAPTVSVAAAVSRRRPHHLALARGRLDPAAPPRWPASRSTVDRVAADRRDVDVDTRVDAAMSMPAMTTARRWPR